MLLTRITFFCRSLAFGLAAVVHLSVVASATTPARKVTLVFADFSERAGLFFRRQGSTLLRRTGLGRGRGAGAQRADRYFGAGGR